MNKESGEDNKLIYIKIISLIVIFISVSCTPKYARDPYLYDSPGFDSSQLSRNVGSNSNIPKSRPDYYNQEVSPSIQGQRMNNQPAYGNYPGQNQQRPNYYYQPTPVPRSPNQQYENDPRGGGSRFYSNPYAIPAYGSGYPYYDSDQYYQPPTYYNNVEPQQQYQGFGQGAGR
jgi:hypothetical protein